jgi:hypothetical protein
MLSKRKMYADPATNDTLNALCGDRKKATYAKERIFAGSEQNRTDQKTTTTYEWMRSTHGTVTMHY